MYEPLLEYARQRNRDHLRKIATDKALAALCPNQIGLSERLLLSLSDLLLHLGARIRPKDLCASAQEGFVSQNQSFAKTAEGV
jgi:hypothetical protein